MFVGFSSGPNIFELHKQHQHALKKAESTLAAAESAGRAMTEAEGADYDVAMAAVNALGSKIAEVERKRDIKAINNGVVVIDGGRQYHSAPQKMMSAAYAEDFYSWIASGGTKIGAALYEGGDSAGGYAVPIMVDSQIVPLAPPEMGVRKLAMVVPTAMDIKVPRKGSFGQASAKAENSAFAEVDPTLEQFTLSAFMAGIQETVSWELAQDVPAFQQFAIDDMLTAQQIYEEAKYVTGSGNGEPQALIGNVGTGVTEEPDSNGNLVSIDGTLNLLGTLKSVYHTDAAWLMRRETGVIIRKAQKQANLFEPVWTRVGAQDFLHGYPVEYSASMPLAARGAAPILFGSFKRGYVIGDRGGSGINVKILDQPKAIYGQIVLLAYRRSDGRVRRSEAIQQYNIAAS